MNNIPLVSIGMPTYNRAGRISRAIESALGQDYGNIELVISDNGSTDGTQAICEEFARRDERVRYIRQEKNRGAAANFQHVFEQSQGQFFMWLSDDDWLDPPYISRCAQVLQNTRCALVCGRVKYFQDNVQVTIGEAYVNLLQRSAWRRVLSYYRQVVENGTFYGLTNRSLLANDPDLFPDLLGGDCLHLSRVAFQGKIRTLNDVSINKSLAGSSSNMRHLAASMGLSGWALNNPCLYIAIAIFKDIAWKSPIYQSAGIVNRFFMACCAASIFHIRFSWWDDISVTGIRFRLALRTRLKSVFKRLGNS